MLLSRMRVLYRACIVSWIMFYGGFHAPNYRRWAKTRGGSSRGGTGRARIIALSKKPVRNSNGSIAVQKQTKTIHFTNILNVFYLHFCARYTTNPSVAQNT